MPILPKERDPRLITIPRGGKLPTEIRDLVLEDQVRRSPICRNVFDDAC